MAIFDEILAKVDAADRTVLDKYPELRQRFDTLETERATAARKIGEWNGWIERNWDAAAEMTKSEKALQAQLAAANARLVDIPAGTDADEIAKLRQEITDKAKNTETALLNSVNGMNIFYRTVADHQMGHYTEFGKSLNSQELMDYMTAQRINDPEIAYDKMMAPRRAEIATQRTKELTEKHAADIEAARKEGYEKHAQETAMGPGGMIPTDSTGGIVGVTSHTVQPAKLTDETTKRFAEAKPGTGELAALGYEMYRQGAFGATQ
jgi:hypothetical protein